MVDRYDEELFLGYIEGDLTPSQKAQFEKQLADDPRLRNLVAQMLADRQMLRDLPDEPAPASIQDTVQPRLERQMLLGDQTALEQQEASLRRYRFSRRIAYSALAAMVLISASLLLWTLTDLNWFHHAAMDETPIADAASTHRSTNGHRSHPPDLTRESLAMGPGTAGGGASGGADRLLSDMRRSGDPAPHSLPETASNASAAESRAAGKAPADRADQSLARAEPSPAPAQPHAARGIAPAESAESSLSKSSQLAAGEPSKAEESAKLGKEAGFADSTIAAKPGPAHSAAAPALPPVNAPLAAVPPAESAASPVPVPPATQSADSPAVAAAPAPVPAPALAKAADETSAFQFQRQVPGGAMQRIPVIESALELRVVSDSAVASHDALLAWAAANRVQTVVRPEPAPSPEVAQRSVQLKSAARAAPPEPATPAPRRVTLVIRNEQVPELLVYLNSQPHQTARFVAAPASQAGQVQGTMTVEPRTSQTQVLLKDLDAEQTAQRHMRGQLEEQLAQGQRSRTASTHTATQPAASQPAATAPATQPQLGVDVITQQAQPAPASQAAPAMMLPVVIEERSAPAAKP